MTLDYFYGQAEELFSLFRIYLAAIAPDMELTVITLTIDEVYQFQKYLASHSITLMIDRDKLTCICMSSCRAFSPKCCNGAVKKTSAITWRTSAVGSGSAISGLTTIPWCN